MSDQFEDALKRWLSQRAGDDRVALQALAGNIAVLPPRQRRPSRVLPLVASIAVLLGAALWLLLPRLSSVSDPVATPPLDAAEATSSRSPTPSPTTSASPARSAAIPGNPYAWLDDPRLHTCFITGRPNQMDYVFEIAGDRDYGLFPRNVGLADELDASGPALVVVFRADVPYPPSFGPDPGPQQPQLPSPGMRVVCMVFGDHFSQAGLDITDLDVGVLPLGPSDPQASGSPATPINPTPTPAPAWLAGAAAALSCAPADFKPNWTRGELFTTGRGTPELAISELAHRANSYGVPFTNEGFREIGRANGSIAYGYVSRGGYRAIVIVGRDGTDASARWWVDDVAVCHAAEVEPYAKTGVRTRRWTDAAGSPADFSVVEKPDCYFGTKLIVEGRLFVWSPAENAEDSYGTAQLESAIGVVEGVPDDALDTGYRSSGASLFLAPDGTAAYVTLPDGVQQWAHVAGDDFQRIDCN
jgi:hypothetical protein